MDKQGALYFCGEGLCLKNDKDASLAIKHSKKESTEKDAAREFGIGSNYTNACLASWITSESNQNITKNWVATPKDFLVYVGVPGSGKTYFSAALCNYIFAKNKQPRYIHIRDFLGNCKKTFDTPGENPLDYVKKVAAADFLVIDDLGSTMNTEWQQELILALIDIRYSNNAATCITTNLSPEQMTSMLGERVSRRLFDKQNKMILASRPYAKI